MHWDTCIEVFGSKTLFLDVWTVLAHSGE
jgi:hypothetical protein